MAAIKTKQNPRNPEFRQDATGVTSLRLLIPNYYSVVLSYYLFLSLKEHYKGKNNRFKTYLYQSKDLYKYQQNASHTI